MPPHKPEVVGQILSALAWRYLPSVVRPGRQASKSIAYSPEYARFVSYSRKLSPGKQVQNRRNGFLNTGADWIGRYGAASGQRESCRVSSSFAKKVVQSAFGRQDRCAADRRSDRDGGARE